MAIIEEHTISIRFYLYLVEKIQKENYPVYMRIIYLRDKADISMRMTATVSEWDSENQMFHPTTAQNRYANNKLLTAKDEITKIYNDLKSNNTYFSVKNIRQKYRGEISEYASMRFLDYYDQYVNDCKMRPAEYGEGVIEHYKKTRRHLQNYMSSKGLLNIKLNNLSRSFIIGFEHYLLSTPIVGKDYAMNRNTATTYIRKVKASVNKALNKELIAKNPFIGYKLIRFKTSNIIYLNNEELEAIRSHDLGGNQSLIRARDLFLYGCFTGLRYSDVIKLRDEDITKDKDNVYWIRITQQKTKELIEVPMLDAAVEIYNKYAEHRNETGYVLPNLCNQKANSYLKIIAKMVGITKRLTFHVGRHTFATTVTLENGVDLKSVSKFLGHSSIKSTEIYARVSKKKLADVVEALNKKLLTDTK